MQPEILVALGATAAQGLFGRDFRVSRQRGDVFESDLAPHCYATLHPSALLRIPDPARRDVAFAEYVGDLSIAADLLRRTA